jgi:Spy/CpxP family protein refolding chaperone
MKRMLTLVAAVAALAPGLASAQHSAYSGQEDRQIKALSDDEIRQYHAGAGMGYARAAELNAFPGPMHALELADQLALSPEQRTATKMLMDAHKTDAGAIGARLVEAERTLDRLFAGAELDQPGLASQVRTVAALYGEYRLSHLETHRRMHAILTPEQVRRYDELRGYAGGPQHGKPRH